MEKQIEVGDFVHVSSRYQESVEQVVKVGKIHFTTTSERKFSIKGGRCTSSGAWDGIYAKYLTPEKAASLKEMFEIQARKIKICNYIHSKTESYSFIKNMSLEHLKAIQQILETYK